MIKIIPSIFCCLFLGIGIADAQTQILCPDPEPLAYAWKNGAVEKVHFTLTNEMKLGLEDKAFYFPDLQFQVSSFINSQGHLICEYRSGASEPLFAISLGKPKLGKEKDQEASSIRPISHLQE